MDFPLPPVGEGLFEVELVKWLVRPGDAVNRGQGLMEVMSDKATFEVPAPFAGTVTALSVQPGTKIKVGQVAMTYDAVETRASAPVKPVAVGANPGRERRGGSDGHPVAHAPGSPEPKATTNGHAAPLPPAAPSVRMLARKLGVDLGRVHGTGPHGRILLDDLTPFLKPKATGTDALAANKTDTSKLDFGVAGTRVKLVGMRRKIAEHMVESKRSIPHYSYIDECNITDLVHLRGQLRETFGKADIKLTYLAFFVKAAARALKEVPIVNGTFDEAAGETQLHDRYNIGIAVAAPNGLIVPVIRDADRRDLGGIAQEIDRLSSDAKAGKSKLEDLKGGTFTVTSVGGIGGLISTPIINHPQVGIMGVGKVVKRPVYDAHNNLRPADIIFLSFSFDHRIVDGAVGAAFGNAVIKHLQNPAVLLLPEKFGG